MGNTEAKYCPINECSDARLICGPTRSYTNVLKSVSNIGDRVTMVLNDISFTGTLSDSTSMSHLNAVIGTYITITYMYQYESMVDMLCGNHKHIYAIRYKTPELSKQQYRLDEYTNTDTLTRMRDIRGYTILLYRDQHDYMKLYNCITMDTELTVTTMDVNTGTLFAHNIITDITPTVATLYPAKVVVQGFLKIDNIQVDRSFVLRYCYYEVMLKGVNGKRFAMKRESTDTDLINFVCKIYTVKMSVDDDNWYEIKKMVKIKDK